MPERQSSPGDVPERPERDATENGPDPGTEHGDRTGGNTRPAGKPPASASEATTAFSSKADGAAQAGGDAGATPAASWFTPVDAEVTQVLARTPAAKATLPPDAAKEPEPATEVIPVTPVAPPLPPPNVSEQDDADTAEPRPRRRKLLVVGAVVGVLVALYAGDLLLGSGSVPRGVTVAGVSLGGLPLDEAEQRLRSEIEPRAARPIPINVGEATSELDPVAAGLAVDWPGTMNAAGAQELNPIVRITSFFTERPVALVTSADAAALNQALEEFAPAVDRAPVEGSVRFEGTVPQAVDPVPGQQLDVAGAAEVVLRDWATGAPVTLPLTQLPATTTPEGVATAIEQVARPAVAAPVTVIGENGVRGTITPDVIASALFFRAENGGLIPEINQRAVQDALAPQMAPSERPGRDATLDFSSGRPVIVPSEDGRGVDYDATLAELLTVLTSTGPREITAVYADQPAETTTEDLEALGNPEVIGEFTTGGFARDSGMNIRRAAEQINGVVVQPGETFSLGQATEPRNAANGYIEAGIISEGRASRGVGGGVSQLATTLYNASYFAGMVDVEHQEHSFYISRYPPGRDGVSHDHPLHGVELARVLPPQVREPHSDDRRVDHDERGREHDHDEGARAGYGRCARSGRRRGHRADPGPGAVNTISPAPGAPCCGTSPAAVASRVASSGPIGHTTCSVTCSARGACSPSAEQVR
jgi:hypothetical protein